MSAYAQSKTKPGTRGTVVNVAGLASDLDVNPPCRAFHSNGDGVLAIWGPDDGLAAASVTYQVVTGGIYPYEIQRIDASASTVTEIVLVY